MNLFLKNPALRRLATILLLVTVSIQCKDDDKDAEIALVSITEAVTDGYTITIRGYKNAEVGFNTLFWSVAKGETSQTITSIEITPMMDMSTMSHSSPKLAPRASEVAPKNWETDVVFTMPSGDSGTWRIMVSIVLADGTELETEIPVSIASSWKLAAVTSSDNIRYYWVWVSPETPKTGSRNYELLLFKRVSMMMYEQITSATATVHPWMDMGGSGHSATVTQPAVDAKGRYSGTINFSMAGDWTFTVTGTLNSVEFPEAIFSMNVVAE